MNNVSFNKLQFGAVPHLSINELIIVFSVFLLFSAIILDFILFHSKSNTQKEKKSIVETGTMIGFFIVYFIILTITKNQMMSKNIEFRNWAGLIGALLVLAGAIINIISRFTLGANWANQIKIYENHYLVHKGFYKLVRHPLYASIILMFLGASFSYLNLASLLSVIIIFLPFMYYRAKQEEKLLTEVFPEYKVYQKNTGMFFPKFMRKG